MGILNAILASFGGPRVGWLINPNLALYIIMLVGLWMSVGHNTIILLAGMQGISKTYYEAAAIDGAGPITQFFRITVPLLTPTIFFVMITSIIGAFQVFDVVYMMVGKLNPAYEETLCRSHFHFDFCGDYVGDACAIYCAEEVGKLLERRRVKHEQEIFLEKTVCTYDSAFRNRYNHLPLCMDGFDFL